MPRAIDLSTVTPQRAHELLKARESKRREYLRKKEIVLRRSKEWREQNKERCAELHKQWREQNRQRKSDTTHASYLRNREKCLARSTKANTELKDSVVKSIFCYGTGLQSKDVPSDLVPAIRLSIQIKREIKQLRSAK